MDKMDKRYLEKYPEVPFMEVTLVMKPNDVRKAMSLGGFDIDDFFKGAEAVNVLTDHKMRADLTDAAAYGLHLLLDSVEEGAIHIPKPANKNNAPR